MVEVGKEPANELSFSQNSRYRKKRSSTKILRGGHFCNSRFHRESSKYLKNQNDIVVGAMVKLHQQIDITEKSDAVATTLLCSFNETVRTAHGVIEPEPNGVRLTLNGARRSKFFPTVKPALRRLRKAAKGTQ